jgi:S1-C subfamily serine protease
MDSATGSSGSGVVVGTKEGFVYILTAAHVVTTKSRPDVETFSIASLPKPASKREKGDVVYRAADSDLALLRFAADKTQWTTATLAPPPKPDGKPEKAWVVGCELGGEPRLTAVSITGKKLVRQAGGASAFFWQANGEGVSGRSGGPLLDGDGRIIGICSGTQDRLSYYSHPDEIRAAIRAAKLDFILGEKDKR